MNVVLMQIYICILFEGAKQQFVKWDYFFKGKKTLNYFFENYPQRAPLNKSKKGNEKKWRKFFEQKKILSSLQNNNKIKSVLCCLFSALLHEQSVIAFLPSWFSKDTFLFVQFLRLNLFPLFFPESVKWFSLARSSENLPRANPTLIDVLQRK